MTIDALICKIQYIFYCFFWCLIFVLKAAFHFGSFIYRSVSGMWPLSSVNNGSDNSKQFSFTLKFLSHCSIFVYFSDVFTFFLCLFILSIIEYSCNVSQTYLRVQKKTIVVLSCIVFSPLETMFFFVSHKKLKIFWGICPLNPHQGFALDPLGGSLSPPRPPADVLHAFSTFLFCFAKNRCTHIFSVLSPGGGTCYAWIQTKCQRPYKQI